VNILIVGQGGREHALAWKIAQSPLCQQVFIAPGNGGTAQENKCTNVSIDATDIDKLIQFCLKTHIDLTVVGPETPLALGIVDQFQAQGLACFGPTQAAAELESSKSFCKSFMFDHNIPTAKYTAFDNSAAATSYLQTQSFPIVIKADGLAAGKGVIIADDFEIACNTVHDMLDDNAFGAAGARVIVEEYLQGEELSFIAMVDGQTILPLASSQDHKRLLDNDMGPNTGGMGAYSPAPICTNELETRIMQQVMRPAVEAMQSRGTPFTGFLYAGMMISESNDINVLEFNCRLGDPETQPLMMRLQSDLLAVILAATQQRLQTQSLSWDPRSAIAIVMAAGGYPTKYEKGAIISGLKNDGLHTRIFHAGTTLQDSHITTNGGRVLAVASLGDTLHHASEVAYEQIQKIHWTDCYYRQDIGKNALSINE